MYYNPDGELTRDSWNSETDSALSLIVTAMIVVILVAFEVIGIITVIGWIF